MMGAFERLRAFAVEHPRAAIGYLMMASCLLVYLPFLGKIETVGRFYDGPLYIVVAKTFYALSNEDAQSFFKLPAKYYACHLPAYPAVIRLCTLFTFGDYTLGMLLATMVCAIAAAVLFYDLLKEFNLVQSPLWSAALFCFFPPRWLIYHSAGASEPLFLCFVFAAFLAYKRNRAWLVVLWICLASLTRITGVLLGPVFLLIYFMEDRWKQVFLMPLSGIGISLLFGVYHLQFNDFFAYFAHNLQHEKIVRWPPLSLLASWLGSGAFHETEYHLMLYGFYGLGTALLWRHRPFFIFGLVYYLFMLFVNHSDVSRYFLSSAAVVVFVGYDRLFSQRAFRLAVLAAVPLFYCYAWGYIPRNVIPADAYEYILKFEKR